VKTRVITGIVLALFLATMLSIIPVAASETTWLFYGNHGWAFNFEYPYLIDGKVYYWTVHAMDIEASSFGPHDVLIAFGVPGYWVAITDNEEAYALWSKMLAGWPIFKVYLVDDNDLEVWRCDKHVFVKLKVDCGKFEARKIKIKGYSPVEPGIRTRLYPTGYFMTISWEFGFDAKATDSYTGASTVGNCTFGAFMEIEKL